MLQLPQTALSAIAIAGSTDPSQFSRSAECHTKCIGCNLELPIVISTLVKSAFQTGCLSVASEGLIQQVLSYHAYGPTDLEALNRLRLAVENGKIEREAPQQFAFLPKFVGSFSSL